MVDVLIDKTQMPRPAYRVERVCICGGVSANACLRTTAERRFAVMGIPFSIPPFAYCTDNAVMTAQPPTFAGAPSPTWERTCE